MGLASFKGQSQVVNEGDLKVNKGTILSFLTDYENSSAGNFNNDGEVHVYENWNNDGVVNFSDDGNGRTFFDGEEQQIIEGKQISKFKNLVFNNNSVKAPIHLSTSIIVDGVAEFRKGIVNARSYGGRVIFNERSSHTGVNNLSFIDGIVEKRGTEMFEFPIGDNLYFRPTFHAVGSEAGNVYTTEYFQKKLGGLNGMYTNKEATIVSVDLDEYWEIIQDKGSEKIILSLTLDTNTTPNVFFEHDDGLQLAIVRWDEESSQWVNEGGLVSDAFASGTYSKLLTSQVKKYGIFTIGLVEKNSDIPNDLTIYNGISPNGDGINDTFLISGINKYPDNSVEIYNRWGVKVYEARSYNEADIIFKGYSDGRATINRGEKLPEGTYFYILKYKKGSNGIEKSGYLYLNNQ